MSSVTVSPPEFLAGTLDDLSVGGTYAPAAANAEYLINVIVTGTPDQFQWSKNNGAYSAHIAITGGAQTLVDGLTITFAATTGHAFNSLWRIRARAAGTGAGLTSITEGVGAQFQTQQQVNRQHVLNARGFGAIGDSFSHPLSDRFATLGAAQVVYPCALNLTDEEDWAALQTAVDAVPQHIGGTVPMGSTLRIPCGQYVINRAVVIKQNRRISIMGDGSVTGSAMSTVITQLNANADIFDAGSQCTSVFACENVQFMGAGHGSGTGSGVTIGRTGVIIFDSRVVNCYFHELSHAGINSVYSSGMIITHNTSELGNYFIYGPVAQAGDVGGIVNANISLNQIYGHRKAGIEIGSGNNNRISENKFTLNGDGTTAGGAVILDTRQPALAVTAATWSAGVATYTVAAHNLFTGQRSAIAGMNPAGYNVTLGVTVLSSTQFTIPIVSNPGAFVSGGTSTGKDVQMRNTSLVANEFDINSYDFVVHSQATSAANEGVCGVLFAGNISDGCQESVIYADGAAQVECVGNFIKEASQGGGAPGTLAAIDLRNCDDWSIDGNKVTYNNATAQAYGLKTSATCSNIKIGVNDWNGTAGRVSLAGTFVPVIADSIVQVNGLKVVELVLNPNVVVNGTFASGASWTLGAGQTISGGALHAVAATSAAYQAGIVPASTNWQVIYTVSNFAAGIVNLDVGTGTGSETPGRSANGTYTEYVSSSPTSNAALFIRFNAFTGDISKVSVRQVLGGSVVRSGVDISCAPTEFLAGAVVVAGVVVDGTPTAITGITALTGDVAASGSGSVTATLATTGVTAAVYGDATHVAQVTFDAKGRATSASNVAITASASSTTGTFTPVLKFGGATTGITYSSQHASYAIIGSQITVQITLVLTSKGSATGAATITGLPYAASTLTNSRFGGCFGSLDSVSGLNAPFASLNQGTTVIDLYDFNGSGLGGWGDANFTNTTTLILTLTYFT